MAAPTISITPISLLTNEQKEPVGAHSERVALLTMVCATSTYADGGLADATNFKSGWFRGLLDFASVRYVEPFPKPYLETADFESAFSFSVDVTNRKVILYGPGGGTSYTATTIAVASATSITDSAAQFINQGFQVGDIIALSGMTGGGAGTNGVAKITAVAAGTLTVLTTSMAADAAGESVTITKIGSASGVVSELSNGVALPDGTYTARVRIYGDYP